MRAGKFLRAGQVLAAVGQCASDSCCKQTQLLQVVRDSDETRWLCRATAICSVWRIHQVAYVARRGAVANIEAIDRLHETTDGFLQEISE